MDLEVTTQQWFSKKSKFLFAIALFRNFFLLNFSKNKSYYQELYNVLGFCPKKLSLYKIALTHNSVHYRYNKNITKINNERLEFLGDSILGFLVAEKLYLKFPYQNEGFLTEMRSKIVGRNKLNAIGKKMGLMNLLKYDMKLSTNHSITDTLSGNALEAIVGAIYLDKGYQFTKDFINKKIFENYIDFETLIHEELSYKAKLIKWAQKEKRKIEYLVLSIEIENKKNVFNIQILLDGEMIVEGRNHSKKLAEELASQKYCNANNI